MSQEQFQQYLLFAAAACGILAIMNLFQLRNRGPRAWFMVSASALMAVTVLAFRAGLSMILIGLLATGVVALLVVDLLSRPPRKRNS